MSSIEILTLGSKIALHLGLMKKRIPFQAPGNVNARINKMKMMTYGNKAKKYDALPELRIPLIRTPAMKIHAINRKPTRFGIGEPRPLSMLFASCRTSFLQFVKSHFDVPNYFQFPFSLTQNKIPNW